MSPFSFGRVNPFPVGCETQWISAIRGCFVIVSWSNVSHAVKRDLSPRMTIHASSPTILPNVLRTLTVGRPRTAATDGRTHADRLHAGKLPDFRGSLERIHESGGVLPTATPRPDFVNRGISTFCLGDYRRIPDLRLISRTRCGRFRCESKISRLLPRWSYRQAVRARLPARPTSPRIQSRAPDETTAINRPERVNSEPAPALRPTK